MTGFIDRLVFDLVVICFSATAAAWFSTFLENAFVRRVKRRMLLRIERFWRSTKLVLMCFFQGTGIATFSVQDIGKGSFLITFARVDFNGRGNLVVVPEPASMLLVSMF